ncbi:hypothetical protein [Pediococcus pentosaceus]|uniref:hypothetical protein n=1 Tax=Pediococcus pentosaceus TaxID=1255 RepID=UPI0018FEC0F9|nr:hypothetical protein [Pediococcus pentosaceus]MBF7122492.1 hypothetical protein [Pediococcus pentosaceus]MBF7131613.1 hypothetical protein [Pediococcus pentosaceus]MCS8563903.1 hypothetical protein [Pediococcus pentosaceus]MCS8568198.1 hypothetical protein [Pediococcus pentosaceus]MCS8580840.1 hypothetical protein [Pediococcus pentosaceus]
MITAILISQENINLLLKYIVPALLGFFSSLLVEHFSKDKRFEAFKYQLNTEFEKKRINLQNELDVKKIKIEHTKKFKEDAFEEHVRLFNSLVNYYFKIKDINLLKDPDYSSVVNLESFNQYSEAFKSNLYLSKEIQSKFKNVENDIIKFRDAKTLVFPPLKWNHQATNKELENYNALRKQVPKSIDNLRDDIRSEFNLD